MALLRTALVAVVAAGAASPREEIAPPLADADEQPAVAPGRGLSGLFKDAANALLYQKCNGFGGCKSGSKEKGAIFTRPLNRVRATLSKM